MVVKGLFRREGICGKEFPILSVMLISFSIPVIMFGLGIYCPDTRFYPLSFQILWFSNKIIQHHKSISLFIPNDTLQYPILLNYFFLAQQLRLPNIFYHIRLLHLCKYLAGNIFNKESTNSRGRESPRTGDDN